MIGLDVSVEKNNNIPGSQTTAVVLGRDETESFGRPKNSHYLAEMLLTVVV